MDQKQMEKIQDLKAHPEKALKLNAIAGFVHESVAKEMPVFIKLVQFDVMTKIQEKAVEDGLHNATAKEMLDNLDEMYRQLDKSLKDAIAKQFIAVKEEAAK